MNQSSIPLSTTRPMILAVLGLSLLSISACGAFVGSPHGPIDGPRSTDPSVYLWCEAPTSEACEKVAAALRVEVTPSASMPVELLTDLPDLDDDCLDPGLLVVLQRLMEALSIDPRNMHDNVGDSLTDLSLTFAGPGCTNCCWDPSETPVKIHRGQVEGRAAFLVRVWRPRTGAPSELDPMGSARTLLWCAEPTGVDCMRVSDALGIEPRAADQIPEWILSDPADHEDDCADARVLEVMGVLRDALNLDPSQWHDNGGGVVSDVTETFAGPGCTNCCWDETEPAVKVHRTHAGEVLVRVWPPLKPAKGDGSGREASFSRSPRWACPNGTR